MCDGVSCLYNITYRQYTPSHFFKTILLMLDIINMIQRLQKKALTLGATDFGYSKAKNKKYYVIYNGRRINFGQKGYEDFTKHF